MKTVHVDVQLLKYLQKPFMNILPVLNDTF